MITFTVPGEPQGKGRVRVVRNHGITNSYTPDATAVYENLVKVMYMQAAKGAVTNGPLDVSINAFFSIPKSKPKKTQAAMLNAPCTKRPDADNIAKSILDALNKIAYEDDSAVVRLCVTKQWDETPRVEVAIKPYRSEL